MPTLNLNIPDEIYGQVQEMSRQLKQTPEDFLLLALHHLIRTDTIDNTIEGITRMEDGEALLGFPELKEELGMEVQFHPMAMEELESLEEEDQIEVLGALIDRILGEDDPETSLDLPICPTPNGVLTTSGFPFGDIIYIKGPALIVYHIALAEEEGDEIYDDEAEEE